MAGSGGVAGAAGQAGQGGGSVVTISLQQGIDIFAGSSTTYLQEFEPDKNNCSADEIEVGYSHNVSFVHFDLTSLPTGSKGLTHPGARPTKACSAGR